MTDWLTASMAASVHIRIQELDVHHRTHHHKAASWLGHGRMAMESLSASFGMIGVGM
jgi:hypothetical protein